MENIKSTVKEPAQVSREEATVFKPFELQGRPLEDQFTNWTQ